MCGNLVHLSPSKTWKTSVLFLTSTSEHSLSCIDALENNCHLFSPDLAMEWMIFLYLEFLSEMICLRVTMKSLLYLYFRGLCTEPFYTDFLLVCVKNYIFLQSEGF